MKKHLFQALLSTTLAVALLLTITALVAVSNPLEPAQRASADSQGGIIGQLKVSPLLTGTRAYTTATNYSSAVYVAQYGSVNVMLANVVTASQVVTVTPQFSLQDTLCPSVTQWYTATTYMPYQPYSITSSATTVTETVGEWQTMPMVERFTVTGSQVEQREFSVTGTCMRFKIDFSTPGQAFTPTLNVRPFNHQ